MTPPPPAKRLKLALLTTDNREQQNRYHEKLPFFGPAPAALIEGFSRLGRELDVHIISCTKVKMPAPEKLADNLWFHQPHVPHLGWGRSFFLGCARAVRKVLREVKPDLVHGQGTERDCAVSAVLSGYPNVLTLHGNMRAVARSLGAGPLSYYGMASFLEVCALRRTQGVFCNSAYTEDQVGSHARRKWRVPNCLHPRFFAPLPAESSRRNQIVVLGSIVHYKQPAEILKMWMAIASQHPELTLAFVGRNSGGPYGTEFQRLLTSLPLAGQAIHIDWLEGEELVRFLDSARGMIHFPTEEAFGLAVAEGLARNLKLFAARTGGVPDAAGGCDGVEFFASDDWNGLAGSIGRWINDGMPLAESAPTVEARYSAESIARRHLDIYRSLLTRP